MKKTIVILFIILSLGALSQEKYHKNQLYIKTVSERINPETLLDGTLPLLKVEPIIKSTYTNKVNNVNRNLGALKEITKIYTIYFSEEIDEFKVSSFLSSLPEIEYSEPIPISRINYTPADDPLRNSQYYLELIQATTGWFEIPRDADTTIIGIVDTGIEFNHNDLTNQIAYNQGELGTDSEGNDKRDNGIDDDNNGYIDDWRGWDFGSNSGEDNLPEYGNDHGVHVAGIAAAQVKNHIGIAGVSPISKILPVKIGSDVSSDNSVVKEYSGLLYAALNGADVINCSWGSGSYSQAEEEIVRAALETGAVIVAAAGNNGADTRFYPASYPGVISVASTDDEDDKSGFSNYNTRVDISAPGSFILSTVPQNEYEMKSGTSMASPVVAGVLGILKSLYPQYNALQLAELLKENSDDIYENNSPALRGKLGRGRVNLHKAIIGNNRTSIILSEYNIEDENFDNSLDIGERINIIASFSNVLDPQDNIQLTVQNDPNYPVDFLEKEFTFENIQSLEEFFISEGLEFDIPENVPANYNYSIPINITSGNYRKTVYLEFKVNPSYRTISNDVVSMTLNSIGNYGFNDYPDNSEGLGFKYFDGKNILFEGSVMATQTKDAVYDVARNRFQSVKDNDFKPLDILNLTEEDNLFLAKGSFSDEYTLTTDSIGNSFALEVEHFTYAFKEDAQNTLALKYKVKNTSTVDYDSLYFGIFFDWDIAQGGRSDIIYKENDIAIAQDNSGSIEEMIAVELITDQHFNFYPIDNPSGTDDIIGIYDGFSDEEKYKALKGIGAREQSNVLDASMVVSAGPIKLDRDETETIVFGIAVDLLKANLLTSLQKLKSQIKLYSIVDEDIRNGIVFELNAFPNPIKSGEVLNLNFNSKFDNLLMKYTLFTVAGNKVKSGSTVTLIGRNEIDIETSGLSSGYYLLLAEYMEEQFYLSVVITN